MRVFLKCLALSIALLSADAQALNIRSGGSRIPAAARAAGYTVNTFSTGSNFTTSTVDMGLTNASGYQWYFWNFFGNPQSSSYATLNANGTATLTIQYTSGGTFVSAAQISSAPYYVGTAFGGGGYFEAELSFNPYSNGFQAGWPAWWMMSLEHLVGLAGEQWSGQAAGYSHFLEVDTFEYDRFGQIDAYGATLHDWYGDYNVTCPAYCVVNSDFNASTAKVPAGTDWTIPHRIATLWIPATSTSNGSYTFYFDDQQVAGPFTYSQFTTQAPPPTSSTSWTFGIGDQQHLVLLIGAGITPLTVKSVNVWQASAAGNLHN